MDSVVWVHIPCPCVPLVIWNAKSLSPFDSHGPMNYVLKNGLCGHGSDVLGKGRTWEHPGDANLQTPRGHEWERPQVCSKEKNQHECSTATRGSFIYSLSFHIFFGVPVFANSFCWPQIVPFSAEMVINYRMFLWVIFFVRKGGSPAEVDLVTRPFRWSPPAHAHQENSALSWAHPVGWRVTYGIWD